MLHSAVVAFVEGLPPLLPERTLVARESHAHGLSVSRDAAHSPGVPQPKENAVNRVLISLLAVSCLLVDIPAASAAPTFDVTLDRATAWLSRSKPGRIKAEGTLRAMGVPIDKTKLTVTVTDGQDLSEPGTSTTCREFSSGTLRCSNEDGTARIRYVPDRLDPDLYRYKLDYRRRDITRPQVGPLAIEFDYDGGAEVVVAKNEPCRVYRSKIVCKGQSVPVCVPEPEVCDGVDNDCNGQVDDNLALASCGVGACGSTEVCANGVLQACVPGPPTNEVCSDGIDNDCDGTTDAADTDCGGCPCGDTWDNGAGAPALWATDLSSYQCSINTVGGPTLIDTVVAEKGHPLDTLYEMYTLYHKGSNTFQCVDYSTSGGFDPASATYFPMTQADMDACQVLLEAQGCMFP